MREEENINKELAKFFMSIGLSQKDVANRMGTSSAYINALLNGRKAIGKKQAAKMENLFGLSSSWLLTGQGEMLVCDENGINVFGNGNTFGAVSNVTNITTNYVACSAENSRADATLNKVLDMLQGAQDRMAEIQKQLTDHNATSVRLLDLLQEKDALILRLTNKLLDK